MKDKILMFIIGTLVGAVITTGIFYIYTKNNNNFGINQELSIIETALKREDSIEIKNSFVNNAKDVQDNN